MKKINLFIFFTILSLSTNCFFKSPKKYSVETDDEKISCTFSLLSKNEKKELFTSHTNMVERVWNNASIKLYATEDAEEPTSYSINPDESNYSVMWVKITNKSDQTIYIPPEEYLDGLQNIMVPKYMVSYFYKEKSPVSEDLLSILAAGISILPLVATPYLFFIENTFDEASKVALSIATGLFGIAFLPLSITHQLNRKKLHKKYLEIAHSAKLYKTNKKKEEVFDFSPEAFAFKLPPGHTIEDLIFANKNVIGRNFFKENEFKLIYSLEP